MLILLYLIVTTVLCTMVYRKIEVVQSKPWTKENEFWWDEFFEVLLYVCAIFWAISIPIYLIYLLVKPLIKRLYKFISKFIN
jgi:hypothetical protein